MWDIYSKSKKLDKGVSDVNKLKALYQKIKALLNNEIAKQLQVKDQSKK